MKTILNLLIYTFVLLSCSSKKETNISNYVGSDYEKLGRGQVAIHEGGGTVSVSWRFSGKDGKNSSFDLYRRTPDGKMMKINDLPLQNTTYYKEKNVDTSIHQQYILCGTGSKKILDSYDLTVKRASVPYISIPIEPLPFDTESRYMPNDISVGDLDGDGELEIVLLRNTDNFAPSIPGVSYGPYILEAYKLDGTRLWQINLGPNIRQGPHYFSFMVGDFDGDGRAEVAIRTGEGTIFGDGEMIGDTNGDGITDYVVRDPALKRIYGKIMSGPEFFSVVEGSTGRELAREDYIQRINSEIWGDDYGCRMDMHHSAIARFDGENLGILMARGIYTRMILQAWNFIDGKLIKLWEFNTDDSPEYKDYEGQENHNLRVGDVDGDGKDEIIYGACAIDHDGTPLYTTKLGHGDAMHMTDIDISRPGMEVWQCHEKEGAGSTLRDAATGEILFHLPHPDDVGRSMCADIDPRYPGCEIWSSRTFGVLSSKGELISSFVPSINMAVWWTGDLNRELLDGVKIDKWTGDGVVNIFDGSKHGLASNNGTKANPCLIADILGDWREEVIWRSETNDEIRIYVTPYETEYRIPCLLEDHVYRMSVAHQNTSYNQPTATGYYLGSDMEISVK